VKAQRKRAPAEESLRLRVAEIPLGDVGKGLVRLDPDDMALLGANPGDLLRISGQSDAVARVVAAPVEYHGQRLILMDGNTRENAGVFKDETVEACKVAGKPAETLVLRPLDAARPPLKDEEIPHLRQLVVGLPVLKGNKVQVTFLGFRSQYFQVEGTQPSGPVMINVHTEVIIKAADVSPEKARRVSYEDVGGLSRELTKIRETVEYPLRYPELFNELGIDVPRGILLVGQPGTGKTLIARALANEINAHFLHLNGSEVIRKFYGESEARIREVFEEARRNAPSLIFFDEVDALAPRRLNVVGDVEKRVVSQFLASMDGLEERGEVVVIGATNVPELLDPALRRPGRFDREILIGVPNQEGRREILAIHTRGMRTDESVDLDEVSRLTQGFVGADLASLVQEAGMMALRRMLPRVHAMDDYVPYQSKLEMRVTQEDFLGALREVEPSARREYFSERPGETFDDVGGLAEVKKLLSTLINVSEGQESLLRDTGLRLASSALVFGPSGCGKTLVAKALAGEHHLTLITVNGPMLFSRWLGESERSLRNIVRVAKQTAPCVLFFDEIDALAPRRGGRGADATGTADRMVTQLLQELSELRNFPEVVVLAATNRPDLLDTALTRGGRFDHVIELEPPDEGARREIFAIHTRRFHLAGDVDLEELARRSADMTGADIEVVCRRAAAAALRERGDEYAGDQDDGWSVEERHFEEALKRMKRTLAGIGGGAAAV